MCDYDGCLCVHEYVPQLLVSASQKPKKFRPVCALRRARIAHFPAIFGASGLEGRETRVVR